MPRRFSVTNFVAGFPFFFVLFQPFPPKLSLQQTTFREPFVVLSEQRRPHSAAIAFDAEKTPLSTMCFERLASINNVRKQPSSWAVSMGPQNHRAPRRIFLALSKASISDTFDLFGSANSFCSHGVCLSRNSRARESPVAALFTAYLKINSFLVTVLMRPFSRTSTRSESISLSMVAELREPRGRPLGFPDCPF